MGMIVRNNLPGNKTLNQLNKNNKAVNKDLKKVATGMKINTAEDDASAFAVSEKMQAQLRAIDQDVQNTQNGATLLKTAEGAIEGTVDILRTLKEKVLNAANDTNTDWDRHAIQKEVDQALQQVEDNSKITYNGMYLIDGSRQPEMAETASHWTNEALAKYTDGDTEVTSLMNRDNESLKIETSDSMTITWVKGGQTYSTTIDPLAWTEEVTTTWTETNPAYISPRRTPNISPYVSLSETNTIAHPYTMQEIIENMNGDMAIRDPDENGANYIGTGQDGQPVYTADEEPGFTLYSSKIVSVDDDGNITYEEDGGLKSQVSGLSFTVKDRNGDLRTGANKALNGFTQTIYAQDPSEDNAVALQVGDKANQATIIPLYDMGPVALGLKSPPPQFTSISVSTREHANVALSVIDSAIDKALDQQTSIGAMQNRLEFTAANLTTASENTQASNSTIRDADMAREMTSYTKNNVLMQASQTMLAQANQSSSAVLSLLQ